MKKLLCLIMIMTSLGAFAQQRRLHESTFVDDAGNWRTTWYESSPGVKDGAETLYNPQGKVFTKQNWSNGTRLDFTQYYPGSGQVEISFLLKDDQINGPVTYYALINGKYYLSIQAQVNSGIITDCRLYAAKDLLALRYTYDLQSNTGVYTSFGINEVAARYKQVVEQFTFTNDQKVSGIVKNDQGNTIFELADGEILFFNNDQQEARREDDKLKLRFLNNGLQGYCVRTNITLMYQFVATLRIDPSIGLEGRTFLNGDVVQLALLYDGDLVSLYNWGDTTPDRTQYFSDGIRNEITETALSLYVPDGIFSVSEAGSVLEVKYDNGRIVYAQNLQDNIVQEEVIYDESSKEKSYKQFRGGRIAFMREAHYNHTVRNVSYEKVLINTSYNEQGIKKREEVVTKVGNADRVIDFTEYDMSGNVVTSLDMKLSLDEIQRTIRKMDNEIVAMYSLVMAPLDSTFTMIGNTDNGYKIKQAQKSRKNIDAALCIIYNTLQQQWAGYQGQLLGNGYSPVERTQRLGALAHDSQKLEFLTPLATLHNDMLALLNDYAVIIERMSAVSSSAQEIKAYNRQLRKAKEVNDIKAVLMNS